MPGKSETLRALLEAFNRGDFDDAAKYLHPAVEGYPAMGGVMDIERRYHGRDGGRHLLETISEGFKNNVEIEDIVEAATRQPHAQTAGSKVVRLAPLHALE